MRQLLLVTGLMLLSAAGCGTSADGGSAADDEFTLPAASGADKPVPSLAQRIVTGRLSFDAVEGGCGYLEIADGGKVEVVYPAGWQLDARAGVLRGPSGEVLEAGTRLTVRGSPATGRSSICQIGPIFEATSVEIATG